jgi:anti-sigma-K factor RskA
MTPTWECTDARPSLGVYVLGAIDPAERALVEAHLATCRECRDELAGLAGLPALLARVDPDEISRISADDTFEPSADDEPPAELIGTVLDLAQARQRRNRWRVVGAAAAAVAIAGGLFGGLSVAASGTRTVTVPSAVAGATWDTIQVTSATTGATASIAYTRELWGDSFQVLVDHIPVGTTCELWVIHPDGTRTQVAAWTTARDEGHVWYQGSMAASAKPISKFQITAGNRVLLTAAAET